MQISMLYRNGLIVVVRELFPLFVTVPLTEVNRVSMTIVAVVPPAHKRSAEILHEGPLPQLLGAAVQGVVPVQEAEPAWVVEEIINLHLPVISLVPPVNIVPTASAIPPVFPVPVVAVVQDREAARVQAPDREAEAGVVPDREVAVRAEALDQHIQTFARMSAVPRDYTVTPVYVMPTPDQDLQILARMSDVPRENTVAPVSVMPTPAGVEEGVAVVAAVAEAAVQAVATINQGAAILMSPVSPTSMNRNVSWFTLTVVPIAAATIVSRFRRN